MNIIIFMFPLIVCIAKKEHDYIEEFVKIYFFIATPIPKKF